MDIATATATFEQLFSHIESTTVFAQDVQAVVSGGVKPEGEHIPVLCSTPEKAVELWLDTARDYKNLSAGNTLVWRAKPEMTEIILHREALDQPEGGLKPVSFFTVYSRLAVRHP